MLSDAAQKEIQREVEKYPADRKRSAVMAALRIVQEEHNWLSDDLMQEVAALLDLQPIQVYEVASFYSMYDLKPVGKHKISVCTNISCMLCGSKEVVEHLQNRLGIKLGETTADGKITLKEVECLAACGSAPALQIGKQYYEKMTTESIDSILDKLE